MVRSQPLHPPILLIYGKFVGTRFILARLQTFTLPFGAPVRIRPAALLLAMLSLVKIQMLVFSFALYPIDHIGMETYCRGKWPCEPYMSCSSPRASAFPRLERAPCHLLGAFEALGP